MNAMFKMAESWLSVFSIHLLEVSVFVLLVLLADKFLLRGVKERYFIWVLALTKLLVPPLFSLPKAIQAPIQGQMPFLQINADVVGSVEPNHGLPLSVIMFTLWLFSASLVALLIAYKNISLRRRLRDCKQIDISGLSDELTIFESDSIQSPILLGLWHPRIYLPMDWSTWPEKVLKSIIAHEKGHIQHRDIVVLSAQYLSLVLFWMNPLVWIVHLHLNQLRELRCDQFAIRRTGVGPVAYSKMIVKFLGAKRAVPMLVGKCFSKN
ncbi:MAG: M56 family metallopeptidase, partial [bacterium]